MALVKRKVANGDDHDASKQSARRKPSKDKRAMLVLIPEESNTRNARSNRPRVPNPWMPLEVTALLICACLAPLAKPVLEGIKLWVDRNKGKKIKIVGNHDKA